MPRRRSHYSSRRRRRNSSGIMDFLMPFLIIIAIVVVIILGIRLWKMIFGAEEVSAGYLYMIEGDAEIKTWGTEDFFNISADKIKVQQGDEIHMGSSGKGILEFFDGTIMRIDNNSAFIIDEAAPDGGISMINILLVDGSLWFNKLYRDTADTSLKITLDNIIVNSSGVNIFDVQNRFNESVHVLNGADVSISVMSEDDDKEVDNFELGVGQEVEFTQDVLQRYWEFESPNAIVALSDGFKSSQWYSWNIKEDRSPTEFDLEGVVSVDEAVEDDDENDPEDQDLLEEAVEDENLVEPDEENELDDEEEPEIDEENNIVSGQLSKPTILSVGGRTQTNENGYYVVTSKLATLTGSVSGASSVVVNGYTLQQFTAGSNSWSYFANADYNLMKPGENTYEVYAVDADGKKSETLTVKVYYDPPPEPEPTPEPEVQPEPVIESEDDSHGVGVTIGDDEGVVVEEPTNDSGQNSGNVDGANDDFEGSIFNTEN